MNFVTPCAFPAVQGLERPARKSRHILEHLRNYGTDVIPHASITHTALNMNQTCVAWARVYHLNHGLKCSPQIV